MTAAIYTDSEYIWGVCSAYFEVSRHPVRRLRFGEPADADVLILDLPWKVPVPAANCKLLVLISAEEVPCSPRCWSYRKPVDLDVMMDRILEFVEK